MQEGSNYSCGFQSTAWESRILLEPHLSSLTSISLPKYPSFLVLLPVWSPLLAFDRSRRQVTEQQVKPSWTCSLCALILVGKEALQSHPLQVHLSSGVLHTLPGFRSLPIGLGFPFFFLIKFILVMLHAGFKNGCWQIVATSLVKM